MNDKELISYKNGYINGLECALRLIRYNREKFGDMDVNKAWIEAHREIKTFVEAEIERVKKDEFKDLNTSVM